MKLEQSIKKIPYQSTWPIRHKVMWPNKPFDYMKLEADDLGIHYGLFVGKELTSIISLFLDDRGKVAQFRKFATLETYQGKGYGSQLMRHLFSELSFLKVEKIWCNARVNKTAFYERFGMIKTDKTFLKGGVEYIVMEKRLQLSCSN